LISGAPALLKPTGVLLIETAAVRAEDSARLLAANPTMRDIRVIKDFEQLSRVTVGVKML